MRFVDTHRVSLLPLALSLLSGCFIIEEDGSDYAQPTGPDICEEQGRYENGICDTDCATPDIECFERFSDPAAAQSWFAGIELLIATEELRQPRRILPDNDPRFIRTRDLIERGWDSYRRTVPVGKLTEPPQVVVVEDPEFNAFVAPFDLLSPNKVGFAVIVHTGLLESGATDAELLGVTMHELEHAVGMHVIAGADERINKYYQVLGGPEPLGFEQENNELAKEAVLTWNALASEAGSYPYNALNGVPLDSSSIFGRLLLVFVTEGLSANPAGCARTEQAAIAMYSFFAEHLSSLDGELQIAGQEQEFNRLTVSFVQALRDECLAGVSASLYDILAAEAGITPAEMRQLMSPEDQSLIDGRHIVDAMIALTRNRHEKMNLIDQTLIDITGGDLSTLRYYSTEEAADDRTVGVLADAGEPADGMSGAFFRFMQPDDSVLCNSILAAGQVPPYGILSDDHHGSCYRAYHVKAIAALDSQNALMARRASRDPQAVKGAAKSLRDLRESTKSLPARAPKLPYTDCWGDKQSKDKHGWGDARSAKDLPRVKLTFAPAQ